MSDKIAFKDRNCSNWKEYFFTKFENKNIFIINQIESEYDKVDIFKITSTDRKCKTEIFIKLCLDESLYDEKYINLLDKKLKVAYLKEKENNSTNTELVDVYFNNPDSPSLTASNELNWCLDGFDTEFNSESLQEIEEILNIPIYYGWIERTSFYDNNSVKIDILKQYKGETVEIVLFDSDNKKYGCLVSLFIMLFENFLDKYKIKKKRKIIRKEENVIEPMIKNT